MNATKDLTQGNPVKLILQFSFPVFLGYLFQEFYHTFDTIIVGRLLGSYALAAVGSTSPLVFLVFGFTQGTTQGFAVLTAQSFGAKNDKALKFSIASNIILNTSLTIIVTVTALITAKPILKIINTPENIFNQSYTYIFVIYAGIGASILYNACACILRSLGDSKTPLLFLIISSISNIILDFIFIKYLYVMGAALATVIAQLFSGIGCFIYIYKKFPNLHLSKKDFYISFNILRQHMKIGIPMGFQFSITAIGSIILQSALNNFGAFAIAGFSSAQKVEHLITTAANTIGVTCANFTGQNIGVKNIFRVRQGVKTCIYISIICCAFSMFIALVFPNQLTSLFVSENETGYTEILRYAKEFLFWCSLCFFPLYCIFIFRNTLQAMGFALIPLLGGVTELLARSIIAYTLPLFLGYTGICLASSIAWILTSLLLIISYSIIVKKHFTNRRIN
ncbi:MAG: MATE family efflux transporter [Treponema sp.]|mgnify:CR=1 FL=1|nr:MATE family efflux transporter [Treponema sp.]